MLTYLYLPCRVGRVAFSSHHSEGAHCTVLRGADKLPLRIFTLRHLATLDFHRQSLRIDYPFRTQASYCCLTGWIPLLISLEQRLEDFDTNGESNLTSAQKLTFMWDEEEIMRFSVLLNIQVNALNLLLQAVQCNTRAQQQDLLLREDSQSILQQAKDCSSSIIGLEDSASFISEITAGIDKSFEFDAIILSSKLYQQAERSHLRQAIKAQYQTTTQPSPIDIPEDAQSNLSEPQTPTQPSPRDISRDAQSNPGELPLLPNIIDEPDEDTELPLPLVRRNIMIMSHGEEICYYQNDHRSGVSELKAAIIRNPFKPPRVLTLGISESGKSTVLKGLKLAYGSGFTLEDRMNFRDLIRSYIIKSTSDILLAMESFGIPLVDEENNGLYATFFHEIDSYELFEKGISSLWLDPGFRSAYERRREYGLSDSAAYYAQEVRRIMAPNYMPTDEDVLYARYTTTGTTKRSLSTPALLHNARCDFLDFGGARSERKKWVEGFQNASVVLFTVDTTAYAKLLLNDETINAMQDQLMLWDSIVNGPWFDNTGFVLLFTKMDLLEECLQRQPVVRCFPDYPGQPRLLDDVLSYMTYLTNRFLSLVKPGKGEDRKLRVRVVEGSLVCNSKETISKISDEINWLAARYPRSFNL
ncbi:G-protein alpha subunit-domain-containing protein [Astrocystis sublimbata]|nr:G-protein alpha subunit-domain-containing protein [Astrocystis sublimbata]